MMMMITTLQLNVDTANYNFSYNYAYYKRKSIKPQIQIHKTEPEARKKLLQTVNTCTCIFHNKIAYYYPAAKIFKKNCWIMRKLISCAKDQNKATLWADATAHNRQVATTVN